MRLSSLPLAFVDETTISFAIGVTLTAIKTSALLTISVLGWESWSVS